MHTDYGLFRLCWVRTLKVLRSSPKIVCKVIELVKLYKFRTGLCLIGIILIMQDQINLAKMYFSGLLGSLLDSLLVKFSILYRAIVKTTAGRYCTSQCCCIITIIHC